MFSTRARIRQRRRRGRSNVYIEFSVLYILCSDQVVAEIRKAVEDKAGAVFEALQTVRRAVMDQSGLLPSRVVRTRSMVSVCR